MNKKKLHLIGNAHLDPVWLWQWQEGYAEIKATFRSALDRLQEFPDFVFTCSCAAYYRWVEENAPEMFQEIQQRVAEGRWVIVGGWWIQPDCNLPSGESFARQGLYSQRYFLEKFGVMANVGYNVDSFGHHGMMPQILKKSGMDYYVFQRPDETEKDLPSDLFWWESEDGSRVMTFRLANNYAHIWAPHSLEDRIELHAARAEKQGFDLMSFYGVGNHGGGPTISNLRELKQLQEQYGEENLVFSSPKQYFAELEASCPQIPVIKDEMQMHAVGCYSTHSESKENNRRAEHRLTTAEKFSVLAAHLMGMAYPHKEIERAWEPVLFNQFHDIMGGCSIKEAFQDAREGYGEALNIGAKTLNAAIQKLSWSINTMKEPIQSLSKESDWHVWETDNLGTPLVVFNPHSWEVESQVQLTKEFQGVTDENEQPVELQRVRASRTNGADDKWDTLITARVPAMGYRVYWAYKKKEFDIPYSVNEALQVENAAMENGFLRIEIDPHTGYIARLFNKTLGVEIFNGHGAVPIVLNEVNSDTWGHGQTKFRNEMAKFSDAEVRVMEKGPIRARLRVTSRYNGSTLRQDFILHRDSHDLEVRVKLDWREQHKMLKLSFPVNVMEPTATYEIPYGFIQRPTNGNEVPGQQWVDISGVHTDQRDLTCGLALANDAKYAYDALGSELRLTVVRSPVFADHFANVHGSRDEWCEFMDQGIQEFRYMLRPHSGKWQDSGIVRMALELNVQPISLLETYHKGPLPQRFEGLSISAEQVIMTAWKRAEENNGYVLRCVETFGREATANLEIAMLNRSWEATFAKCEIKTFHIPDDPSAPITEVNLLEF